MKLATPLSPSIPLLYYETFLSRKPMTPYENQQYQQLHRGFIGEVKLAKIIETSNYQQVIPLFDCLYERDGKEFQIDCLLITASAIFLLEVKNYSDNYYMENNQLFNLQTKTEIYNPLSQLERSELLLKRLLQTMKIELPVRSYVIFINDHFTLYGASTQLPIILPSQVNRFLQKINANAASLTATSKQISQRLTEKQKTKSTYERLPTYSTAQLQQGVFCESCHIPLRRISRLSFMCERCKRTYDNDEVILYAIAQYTLLLPGEKITTQNINEWCGNIFSRVFISKFLKRKLNLVRNGRYSYYTFSHKDDPLRLLANSYKNNLRE